MIRFLAPLLLLLAFLPNTAHANKHGKRMGAVFATHFKDNSFNDVFADVDVDEDFSDSEIRGVLALLQSYIGDDSLAAHVHVKPKAFRFLRLRRMEAYVSLLGVFLEPEQIADVLRANFEGLKSDTFTAFLVHESLVNPYKHEDLPKKLRGGKMQRNILAALAEEIEKTQFPLASGRARAILVAHVAKVEAFLADHKVATPPLAKSEIPTQEALRELVLRYRRLTTDPDERVRVGKELMVELPALLARRLQADLEGTLGFDDLAGLNACIDGLLR